MTFMPLHRWWKLSLVLALVLLVIGASIILIASPLVHARPLPVSRLQTPTLRVLFDDAHTETAGNADWVMSKSQPDPLGENLNPQQETDWTGGISAWGVTLQKTGRYSLMTNTSALTYSSTSNPLDLSNFNALILPEPNNLFTSSEKTAILTFVRNGGGLFMVADHSSSDRNNDGYDSLHVLNDLMNNSGVGNDPFGIQFDNADIAKDYPSVDTPNPDPILQGPFGTGTTSLIDAGTTETINPADNSAVVGVIYITGASASGTTGVFIARSTYGNGRVIAVGDSSAIDDGTCESGNHCYNGWGDRAAQNGILFPNGTEWLASGGTQTPTPTVTTTATSVPTVGTTPTVSPTSADGITPTTTTTSFIGR